MTHVPVAHLPVAAARPGGEENSLDIQGLWNAFRRRWFLATSVGLLLGAGAAVPAYMLAPAPYETFAEFHISSVDEQIIPGPTPPKPQYNIWKETQMKLVRLPFVLNAALRDPKVSHARTLADAVRQVDWLAAHLRVEHSGPEFFRIGLSGEYPAELKAIVDAVGNAYLSEVVSKDEDQWLASVSDLKKAQRKLEDELTIEYRNLQELANRYQRDPNAASDPHGVNALVRVQMMQQLVKVRMDLMEANLLLGEMTSAELKAQEAAGEEATGESDEIPRETLERHMASVSPEYAELYDKLPILERHAKRNRENLSDNHPRRAESEQALAEARAELEALEKDLLPKVLAAIQQGGQEAVPSSTAELQRRIALMESEKVGLETEIENLKTNEREAGTASVEIDKKNTKIELLESVRMQIASSITRLEVTQSEGLPSRIERVQEAEVPVVRSLKKKATMAGGAGLGMMGLFVAGVVLLEYRARRVSTVDEVAGGLNLRVMGLVPQIPRDVAAGKSARSQTKSAYWSSVLTESIDSTRTQLLRDARHESLSCLMVASAMSGEGKTTLCCHLATSLARAGRKVVLVDCDVRRPSIHKVFSLPPSAGVCEVLRREIPLEDAIVELESPANLSILPAGAMDRQIPQLLAQDRLAEILEPLKAQFDFVVIDSSPILPVTDSLLVAQHCDAALLAVRRDVSRLPKVHAARERLAMLGVPILGAVAIGLREEGYDYRPGRGYGYAYSGNDSDRTSAPNITAQSSDS